MEIFKREFNIFYSRSLKSFGKWKNNSESPAVGSIVYILDKTTDKANFLQKFKLGRISKYLSQHTVELNYMNQTEKEGTSQDLIKELRTGRLAKVTLKKCVRDLRDLSVIIDPTKQSEWAKGIDIDQLMADPVQEDDQEDDQGQAQEKAHENVDPAPASPAPTPAPAPVPTAPVPEAAPPAIVPVNDIVHVTPMAGSNSRADRPTRRKVRPQRYR